MQKEWLLQMRTLLGYNVPRFINHIIERGGPSEEELRWLQCEDGQPDYPMEVIIRADEYLFFPKDKKTFEKGLFILVKCLSIMAFIPGGVRFLGMHFSSQIDGFVENEK